MIFLYSRGLSPSQLHVTIVGKGTVLRRDVAQPQTHAHLRVRHGDKGRIEHLDGIGGLQRVAVAGHTQTAQHQSVGAVLLHRLVREKLTVREAEVIRLRYGLGGTIPLTQREVAALFGISRSYVSRIEKKALEKLKAELGE